MLDYETPFFVDAVLCTIYALLLLATGLALWSVVRGVRRQGREAGRVNGVPVRRIALGTALLLLLTMAATWLLGSTQPIEVNGQLYADSFWLRTCDMLLLTPAVLLVVIGGLVLVGEIRRRKGYV